MCINRCIVYGNCGLLRSTSTDTVLIVGELYCRYGSSSLVSSGDRISPHGGAVHLSHVHGLLGDSAASIRSHPEPKGSIVSENRRTLYKEQQSNFNNTTISNLRSSWCCGGGGVRMLSPTPPPPGSTQGTCNLSKMQSTVDDFGRNCCLNGEQLMNT